MQNRRAIFLGLGAAMLGGAAAAKPWPQADDAAAPGVCRRCGQIHGQPDAPLKAGSK